MSNQVKVVLILSVTAWLAHFFYFRDFGLYEDDYVFISDATNINATYLLEKLQYFILWPQGRPFGFYLPSLFSFLGDKLGGLSAIYLLGFLIVTLNAYLFYRIIKRIYPTLIAVIGGLAFCLFPADSTNILFCGHFARLKRNLAKFLISSRSMMNCSVVPNNLFIESFKTCDTGFVVIESVMSLVHSFCNAAPPSWV